MVHRDPKVFTLGDFVIGFTTSYRMGQLLQFNLEIPCHHDEVSLFAYMVTVFIDAVRECLKTGGYAEKAKEVEKAGTFLVGYKGHLFRIEGDYQVAESALSYDAIGCGG